MNSLMYDVLKNTYEKFQGALSKEFLVRAWLFEEFDNPDNYIISWPKQDLLKIITAADGLQYVDIDLHFSNNICRHIINRQVPLNIFLNPTKENVLKLHMQFLEDSCNPQSVETRHDQFMKELYKRFEPKIMGVGETYEQAFLKWLDNLLKFHFYKWDSNIKEGQFVQPQDDFEAHNISVDVSKEWNLGK